ncbi:hypothetical protein EGK75_01220 [Neisseria weixii]|uniref:Uncharacterized protein n=1 Tax=Neisseria weixii TaxID=1853276 RepID=A0A3N4N2M7_9NEIS|nr:hypothetical protein [Neisseria weixii]RPD90494.1 hypothetical protein EGK74_01725 [Neisseria weixii]RPD90564.1 hypothetical protein EGK75_01220 [Neisseria weixii]
MKPDSNNTADYLIRAKITQPDGNQPQIEKQIPIPPKSSPNHYPFDDMEIGDSFFVPCRPGEPKNTCRKRLQGAFQRWRESRNSTLSHTTRQATKDGITGIRLWIIEK